MLSSATTVKKIRYVTQQSENVLQKIGQEIALIESLYVSWTFFPPPLIWLTGALVRSSINISDIFDPVVTSRT